MFKIICIILSIVLVNPIFANRLPILSKIEHKASANIIKNVHNADEYPDFTGEYKGTCTVDHEVFDDLTFTIYSNQYDLKFKDYNDVTHEYVIGGASTNVYGKNDAELNDAFSFTSVYRSQDKSALIIRSTMGMQASDVDAELFTLLEEVVLRRQDDKLILNASNRRFYNLEEYGDADSNKMECIFTKVYNARS